MFVASTHRIAISDQHRHDMNSWSSVRKDPPFGSLFTCGSQTVSFDDTSKARTAPRANTIDHWDLLYVEDEDEESNDIFNQIHPHLSKKDALLAQRDLRRRQLKNMMIETGTLDDSNSDFSWGHLEDDDGMNADYIDERWTTRSSDGKSKSARRDNGSATRIESELSGLSSNLKISPVFLSALQKRKESNRKYAQDSRNRRKQRMDSLEKLIAQQESIIEIYKKAIIIYHKRLKNGATPSWSSYEIHLHSPGSKQDCINAQCSLPILDDGFLKELNKCVHGKIVLRDSSISYGSSMKHHATALFYSDQKDHETISRFMKSKNVYSSDKEIDRQINLQPSATDSTKDHLNSQILPINFSQVNRSHSLEKVRHGNSVSVSMDTNGSDRHTLPEAISLETTTPAKTCVPEATATIVLDEPSNKVGQQRNTTQSSTEDECLSHATTSYGSPFVSRKVRRISNPSLLSDQKITELDQSLPEEIYQDFLALHNRFGTTSSGNVIDDVLDAAAIDSTAHVFDKTENDLTGSKSPMYVSDEDTNAPSSDDVDSLEPSLETV